MASLVLSIDVTDKASPKVRAFQDTVVRTGPALSSMGSRAASSGRMVDSMGGYIDRTSARIRSMLFSVKSLIAALGIGFSVAGIVAAGDAYKNMQARVALVTKSEEERARVTKQLYDISQAGRADIEATTQMYVRLAQGADKLGISQSVLISFTDRLNKLIVISGASSAEASAALIQLSQAIASNRLGGDELRSVMEQLPAVARTIADYLGVDIGKFREMAKEGEITASVVVNAILSAGGKIDDQFSKMPMTVGQALTKVKNAALVAFGSFDSATGFTASIASGFEQATAFIERNKAEFADWGTRASSATKTVVENIWILTTAIKVLIALQLASWLIAGFSAMQAGIGTVMALTVGTHGLAIANIELAAAILLSSKAWAAFMLAVKTAGVAIAILAIVEAVLYLRRHTELTATIWANLWFGALIVIEKFKTGTMNLFADLVTTVKVWFYDLVDEIVNLWNNLQGQLNRVLPDKYKFTVSTQITNTAEISRQNEDAKNQRNSLSQDYINDLIGQLEAMKTDAINRTAKSAVELGEASKRAGKGTDDLANSLAGGAGAAGKFDQKLSDLSNTLSGLQNAASIMRELDQLRVRAGEMSDTQAEAGDLAMQRQILEASIAKAQYEASAAKEVDDRARATQEVLNLTKQLQAVPELERLNQKIRANQTLLAQAEAELNLMQVRAQIADELSRSRIDVMKSVPGFQSKSDIAAQYDAQDSAIRNSYAARAGELEKQVKNNMLTLSQTQNEDERKRILGDINALMEQSNSLGERMANDVQVNQNNKAKDLQSEWEKYVDQLKADLEDMSSIAVSTAQSATSSFGSFFTDLITREQSAKDSWLDFIKSVRDSFLNAVGEMLAKKALLTAADVLGFGGMASGVSSMAATNLNTTATTANTAAITALTTAMAGTAATGAASGAATSAAGALVGESSESVGIMSGIWSGVKRFGSILVGGFSAIGTFMAGIFSSIGSALMSGLGAAGGFAMTGLTSLFALLASGGVFMSGGNLSAFAQGGAFTNSIVTRPTYFAMANGTGLMGEAGPEAVMPLTRLSGGRLGVSASGSGVDIERLIAALERNQAKSEKTEIVIYNLIDSEALLAPIASDAGKQIITNHIGADFNENGPIRQIVQGK